MITPAASAGEGTPLILPSKGAGLTKVSNTGCDVNNNHRLSLHLFLEATTWYGAVYEKFTICLIVLSVITFVLSSVFVAEYNINSPYPAMCGKVCDAIWFGNNKDNALSFLNIGSTSIVELIVVSIFSIDYLLRFYTADLQDVKYIGLSGRLQYVVTFFSLVDLASTVPFYLDAFILTHSEFAASNFLRMFRLLRMMKAGKYDTAFSLIDDVLYAQKAMLGTAAFVGMTVWGVLSSFYYIVERENPDMIYCGAASGCDDVDTSLCVIDEWGLVDCTDGGCPNGSNGQEVCWGLYRSIISSSFWTLIELFGEFPLIDMHSTPWGRVLGTFTAVFAVAVFALPVGVLASGFEDQIAKRHAAEKAAAAAAAVGVSVEVPVEAGDFVMGGPSFRGKVYDFLHRKSSRTAELFAGFTQFLIIGCALSFMLDSVFGYKHHQSNKAPSENDGRHNILSGVQMLAAIVFALESIMRKFSAGVNPKYAGLHGLCIYMCKFHTIIDLISILPYFIGMVFFPTSPAPSFFLLLRIFHFERCSESFRVFDDIILDNLDVLSVTGFAAGLLWIFFSSVLYFTERDNPDEEMANWYSNIPNSMWMTMLNLSGECPLANYSTPGKFIIGIIGLFATAIFGVPIGILGAGFEELIAKEHEDKPDETESTAELQMLITTSAGRFPKLCHDFVNGKGSQVAATFEQGIFVLIGLTVTLGVIQTVPEWKDVGSSFEFLAIAIFTVEYIMRLIGAVVDPNFAATGSSPIVTRLKYVFSFYSIIDLLAILPFYYAYANPNSWIDQHDEYLRMIRLLRLLKLEKYVPSISLLDDVFRLKKDILTVAGYAALTLWFLFTGAMYVAERNDHAIGIDPVPLYGCAGECAMSDRYTTYFSALPLTGIHLTGDFPLVEYGGFARVILFFAVLAAVGVVAIPSGVIASGFAEIVATKLTSANPEKEEKLIGKKGDDWFDIHKEELKGVPPPPSPLGPRVDALQFNVLWYLEGKEDETTGEHVRSGFSKAGRVFFFVMIISNVIAVICESVPEIDKSVGNKSGNFFDVFEELSVLYFTSEYLLRLFSAAKNREALYSPLMYARTFFGLVDLLTILPWYIQVLLLATGVSQSQDAAKVFRVLRIFRLLQLEDFVPAFSKLDNVFRATKDIMKATGLMAMIVWVGCAALFYIFEQNNPNFRECDASVPLMSTKKGLGCFDFQTVVECNAYYGEGMCTQTAFQNMPQSLYYVAVFLGGEWGVVDFTVGGKFVCMFLCIAGIALYSIPVGALFDAFGAVIGLAEEEEEEDTTEEEWCSVVETGGGDQAQ